MSNFITILKKSVVASTKSGVLVTDQFKNITVDMILDRLKQVLIGEKNGGHFIRMRGHCPPPFALSPQFGINHK